jgi:hypothetical protein
MYILSNPTHLAITTWHKLASHFINGIPVAEKSLLTLQIPRLAGIGPWVFHCHPLIHRATA